MNLITKQDISKELRCLRTHLSPILSEHYKSILKEAERRLTGEVTTTSPQTLKKNIKIKRPTKKELYNRFFYKNLF